MIDPSRRRRSRTLLTIAIAMIVLGLISVAAYAVGFFAVLDQADQSMAFWLLPFLFLGLAAAGVGAVLVVLWLLLVSTERSADPDRRGLEGGDDQG